MEQLNGKLDKSINVLQKNPKVENKFVIFDEWGTRSKILKTKEEIETINLFFGNKNISSA